MIYTPTFRSLLEEAQFTRQILGTGVTMLRKANYANKGYYFSAFTNISTGLERIGKLCLLLDFYFKNSGKFPDEKNLKNNIGHDLEKLYQASKSLIEEYDITFHFDNNIEDDISCCILKILSNFARGDRYYNINYLVNSKFQNDPIHSWHKEVDIKLYDTRVSGRIKKNIELDAKIAYNLMNSFTSVKYYGDFRGEIYDIGAASYWAGFSNAVSKYRQLYVLRIIRYWVEILISLQYMAMRIGKSEIPFFSELFSLFHSDDAFFLTRKNYDSRY